MAKFEAKWGIMGMLAERDLLPISLWLQRDEQLGGTTNFSFEFP